MAGFSSTVKPVGKPAKAPFGVVGSSLPKPPKAYNVSGYFNGAGQPTFAKQVQSPPVAQAVAKAIAAQGPGPAAAGQTPGTSGTQTGGPSSSGSGSGAPVLDATALNNIATNQFKANNDINSLNSESSASTLALQNALGQFAYQQPRDQLGLEQGANQRGALYSSVYNQDLGNLNHSYLTKQNDAATTNDQAQSKIAAQIQAILGGVPLYNQGQAADSVQRAIAAAAANPATGQPPSLTPEQVKYIKAGMAGGGTSTPPSTRSNPISQAPHGHPAKAANPFFSQGYVDSKGHWVSTVKNPAKSTRPRIIDPFAKGRH